MSMFGVKKGVAKALASLNAGIQEFYLHCEFSKTDLTVVLWGPSGPSQDVDLVPYASAALLSPAASIRPIAEDLSRSARLLVKKASDVVLAGSITQRDLGAFLKRFGVAFRADLEHQRPAPTKIDFKNISLPPFGRNDWQVTEDEKYYYPTKLMYGAGDLELTKFLGKGGYGIVLEYRGTDGANIALKIMRAESVCFDTGVLTNNTHCECIIEQACLDGDKRTSQKYVLMETAVGDLYSIREEMQENRTTGLRFSQTTLEPDMIIKVKCIMNICKALVILENNAKAYTDMKPRNVLYTKKPVGLFKNEIVAKLGDLDGACHNGAEETIFAREESATYPAPELWGSEGTISFAEVPCKKEYNSWGVGVILISFIEPKLLDSLEWSNVGNRDWHMESKHGMRVLESCAQAIVANLLLMDRRDVQTLQSIFTFDPKLRPSLSEFRAILSKYLVKLRQEVMEGLFDAD